MTLQLQLARDDPRDVEQIPDELRLYLGGSRDSLYRPLGPGAVQRASAQELHLKEQRGQRRAELVRQHGQELILGPGCRFRLPLRFSRLTELGPLAIRLRPIGDVFDREEDRRHADIRANRPR